MIREDAVKKAMLEMYLKCQVPKNRCRRGYPVREWQVRGLEAKEHCSQRTVICQSLG